MTAMTDPNQMAAKTEILGDALFVLSDKLRKSGFLENNENHAAYERVVKAFTAIIERDSNGK
jgi:hypothetical protein